MPNTARSRRPEIMGWPEPAGEETDVTSGDTAAQRAAILERARDLREQAHRVMAPSDAVAAATEDDIRDYLRDGAHCAVARWQMVCPEKALTV